MISGFPKKNHQQPQNLMLKHDFVKFLAIDLNKLQWKTCTNNKYQFINDEIINNIQKFKNTLENDEIYKILIKFGTSKNNKIIYTNKLIKNILEVKNNKNNNNKNKRKRKLKQINGNSNINIGESVPKKLNPLNYKQKKALNKFSTGKRVNLDF